MTTRAAATTHPKSGFSNVIGWLLGIVFLTIGFINTFWGNDAGFGIFLAFLSLVYLPPVPLLLKKKTGFEIPVILKIILGAFIVWAALGVGELSDKINLMLQDM